MQFLHPLFLAAIGAIVIPIIIHLFYFRRYKKVFFTNVSFLKEIKEETAVRSRLRNLLVLTMRCLALIFIVFAFAQPFLNGGEKVDSKPKTISIYVDNSLSMSALLEDVSLLERAKSKARAIIQAYEADDQFNVFTNVLDFRSRSLLDKEAALAYIDEIEDAVQLAALENINTLQAEVLNSSKGERERIAYLISDFQSYNKEWSAEEDSSFSRYLMPIQSAIPSNVSIDSVWFERPVLIQGQSAKLFVALENYSVETAENTRLSYSVNGENKPLGQLSIPGESRLIDTVNISFKNAGYQDLFVQISDYPVQFDDTFHLSFEVKSALKVLSIESGEDMLSSGFRLSTQMNLESVKANNIDYAQLANYDLILLNELDELSTGLQSALSDYLQEGGNVFYTPFAERLSASNRQFLNQFGLNLGDWSNQERTLGRLNTDSYIFKDVFENPDDNLFLPSTSGYYASVASGRPKEVIMQYRNGQQYLTASKIDKGNFYLMHAPLSKKYNTLLDNPAIFVPMLYKMASSSSKYVKTSYTIGEDAQLRLTLDQAENEEQGAYVLRSDNEEFIPGQQFTNGYLQMNVYGQVSKAGTFELQNPSGKKEALFAFNYDRKESDLSYLSESELLRIFGTKTELIANNLKADLTEIVKEKENGLRLWTLFLVLALLCLLAESLLLRFWKIN